MEKKYYFVTLVRLKNHLKNICCMFVTRQQLLWQLDNARLPPHPTLICLCAPNCVICSTPFFILTVLPEYVLSYQDIGPIGNCMACNWQKDKYYRPCHFHCRGRIIWSISCILIGKKIGQCHKCRLSPTRAKAQNKNKNTNLVSSCVRKHFTEQYFIPHLLHLYEL
jgi:hypothetical protein